MPYGTPDEWLVEDWRLIARVLQSVAQFEDTYGKERARALLSGMVTVIGLRTAVGLVATSDQMALLRSAWSILYPQFLLVDGLPNPHSLIIDPYRGLLPRVRCRKSPTISPLPLDRSGPTRSRQNQIRAVLHN